MVSAHFLLAIVIQIVRFAWRITGTIAGAILAVLEVKLVQLRNFLSGIFHPYRAIIFGFLATASYLLILISGSVIMRDGDFLFLHISQLVFSVILVPTKLCYDETRVVEVVRNFGQEYPTLSELIKPLVNLLILWGFLELGESFDNEKDSVRKLQTVWALSHYCASYVYWVSIIGLFSEIDILGVKDSLISLIATTYYKYWADERTKPNALVFCIVLYFLAVFGRIRIQQQQPQEAAQAVEAQEAAQAVEAQEAAQAVEAQEAAQGTATA